MKLRPILVLLLFVCALALLVWIYHLSTNGEPSPKRKLWATAIEDLNVYSRRQHAKSEQYDQFAVVAQEQGEGQIAKLFRALAFSDRLSEHNCVEAIQHLGGVYQPPRRIVVFRGTTCTNLQRSIEYEQQIASQEHQALIARTLNSGNRYAARVLIWAAAADQRHIALMRAHQCEQRHLQRAQFMVCPLCGNTYSSLDCDNYCPHCLTQRGRFVRF